MYGYEYDYGYGYGSYDSAANAIGIFAGVGIFMWIIGMAVAVFSVISMWKLFKKAGKPGWASIVPIYNMIVMIEIAELPMWYIVLFFVPFANIYAMFKIYIEIAHKFGKSTGFGIGMVFLNIIFIPMLAFGKAEYKGCVGSPENNNVNMQTDVQNNTTFNSQINVQNSNLQSNIMDVNSGFQGQSMFDVNMQNSGNSFQPVGDINNNVQGMNINSMQSNTIQDVNSMNSNGVNYGEPVNTILTQSTSDLNSGVQFNNSQVLNQVNMNNNVVPTMSSNSVSIQPNNMQTNNVNHVQSNLVQNTTPVNLVHKVCPNCGNQMDFNVTVCSNCGQNL